MKNREAAESFILEVGKKMGSAEPDVASAFYILALKKMIDENACTDPEDMAKIVDITKIMFRPSTIQDIDLLNAYSDVVEKTYGLQRGILDEVLHPAGYQAKSWERYLINLINTAMAMELDAEDYYPLAAAILRNVSEKTGRLTSMNVSSEAISRLLSIGADIHDGDVVLDGTVGYGYSAMKAINGKKVSFYGMDISARAAQVAALYGILCGQNDCHIAIGDFTTNDMKVEADKVVMDIPLGIRSGEQFGSQLEKVKRWMDTDSCREGEAILIASAIDSLKKGGRLVAIVSSGFLFKQTKALVNFRRNLVKEGLLKAVISLPPVHDNANVASYMLIFEQGCKDVLFVDAEGFIQRERRGSAVVTEEGAEALKRILENKECITKVSFIVTNEVVMETGDWSINQYIDTTEEIHYRSVKDINEDLAKCMNRLNGLNSVKYKLF